jgi:hypothetical protein
VTYALDEAGRVVATIRRCRTKRRCTKIVRTVRVGGKQGSNRLRLNLRRGRYRLTMVVTDAAGNASRPTSLRFRRR